MHKVRTVHYGLVCLAEDLEFYPVAIEQKGRAMVESRDSVI